MAEEQHTEKAVRREISLKLVGIVATVVTTILALIATALTTDLLKARSAELTDLHVTPQSRGAHFAEQLIDPTADEAQMLNDRGVRVEAEMKIHRYKSLDVACTLTPANGREQRERYTWHEGDPTVTKCWFVLVYPQRGTVASVRLFKPSVRDQPLDIIGPQPLAGS